jgi:hypothetical protein
MKTAIPYARVPKQPLAQLGAEALTAHLQVDSGGPAELSEPDELSDHLVPPLYLPPSSPELNRIECVWRSVKYQDMPVRAYTTTQGLHTAVDHALTRRATTMTPTTTHIRKIA